VQTDRTNVLVEKKTQRIGRSIFRHNDATGESGSSVAGFKGSCVTTSTQVVLAVMNDDGSAENAVLAGQRSQTILEGVLDASTRRNDDVGPIADVSLFVPYVTMVFALGVEMTFGRIAAVGDDVSRLMNVKSVLLGRGISFEAGKIH